MALKQYFQKKAWSRLYDFSQLGRVSIGNFRSGLGNGAWLIYGLIKNGQPDVCVEIGSALGRSACFIGRALQENGHGKLYAIDPHTGTSWNDVRDTYDVMSANLRKYKVQDRVEILRGYSTEIAKTWTKPIDFLFIDGDHSYEGVKADWDLFSPFMKPFGQVIFHDTIWDVDPKYRDQRRPDMGVPRFVEDLRKQGYPVITIDQDFGLSIVQATKGGTSLIEAT